MTPTQVKMPQNLTAKDLDGIAYVYSKMSLASKQSFLASLIIEHPEHFGRISKAIGEKGMTAMAQA